MSSSVRPQRLQPTRLPSPWDSPGKNTGVGCHFLLQCMKVKSESEVVQSCPTLRADQFLETAGARPGAHCSCANPPIPSLLPQPPHLSSSYNHAKIPPALNHPRAKDHPYAPQSPGMIQTLPTLSCGLCATLPFL